MSRASFTKAKHRAVAADGCWSLPNWAFHCAHRYV